MTTLDTSSISARSFVPTALPVHLVGSLPEALGADALTGMRWILDQVGHAPLTAMPFDSDHRWIIRWLEQLRNVDALETVRGGDSRGYDDMPYYRIKPGGQLSPADLSFGLVARTADAMRARNALIKVGHAVPVLVQVGVPNALDRALFASGGPDNLDEWLPTMQASLRDEVAEVADRWGDSVLFQLESPAILVYYQQTPRSQWPGCTTRLVDQVAGVFDAAPRANWLLHLCYGDLEHRALIEPADLDAPVRFLNALSDHLADTRTAMPAAHLPIAFGDQPPSTDARFYEALTNLRRDVRIVGGVVDEAAPDATHTAVKLMVAALNGPLAGIAAACGHGRRSIPEAAENVRLAMEVAREWALQQVANPSTCTTCQRDMAA